MEIEEYNLIFSGRTQSEITFNLQWVKGSKKALEKANRKIYVVKHGERFLYVGEADCTIDTRLRRGFTSYRFFVRNGTKRGGYQGYKWIKLSDSEDRPVLQVYVHVFDEKYHDNREFVQAVEGELVFLIREDTKQWPEFQNEIHFRNNAEAKQFAEAMFEELKTA